MLTTTDFQFRSERYVFSYLDNVTNGGVAQEPLQVQNKYGWQRVDELLSCCVDDDTRPCRRRDLYRVWMRDVLKGIFYRRDLLALPRTSERCSEKRLC